VQASINSIDKSEMKVTIFVTVLAGSDEHTSKYIC